jgi:hypothetical protein
MDQEWYLLPQDHTIQPSNITLRRFFTPRQLATLLVLAKHAHIHRIRAAVAEQLRREKLWKSQALITLKRLFGSGRFKENLGMSFRRLRTWTSIKSTLTRPMLDNLELGETTQLREAVARYAKQWRVQAKAQQRGRIAVKKMAQGWKSQVLGPSSMVGQGTSGDAGWAVAEGALQMEMHVEAMGCERLERGASVGLTAPRRGQRNRSDGAGKPAFGLGCSCSASTGRVEAAQPSFDEEDGPWWLTRVKRRKVGCGGGAVTEGVASDANGDIDGILDADGGHLEKAKFGVTVGQPETCARGVDGNGSADLDADRNDLPLVPPSAWQLGARTVGDSGAGPGNNWWESHSLCNAIDPANSRFRNVPESCDDNKPDADNAWRAESSSASGSSGIDSPDADPPCPLPIRRGHNRPPLTLAPLLQQINFKLKQYGISVESSTPCTDEEDVHQPPDAALISSRSLTDLREGMLEGHAAGGRKGDPPQTISVALHHLDCRPSLDALDALDATDQGVRCSIVEGAKLSAAGTSNGPVLTPAAKQSMVTSLFKLIQETVAAQMDPVMAAEQLFQTQLAKVCAHQVSLNWNVPPFTFPSPRGFRIEPLTPQDAPLANPRQLTPQIALGVCGC